jgi:hypothetical protein
LSIVSYDRVLYFDDCLFDGTLTGAMTGRGAIFRGCVFNTPTGIQFDGLSAQQWPYGVTVTDNTFLGTPFVMTKTTKTFEDIEPHQVTIESVYAAVKDYRATIISE